MPYKVFEDNYMNIRINKILDLGQLTIFDPT